MGSASALATTSLGPRRPASAESPIHRPGSPGPGKDAPDTRLPPQSLSSTERASLRAAILGSLRLRLDCRRAKAALDERRECRCRSSAPWERDEEVGIDWHAWKEAGSGCDAWSAGGRCARASRCAGVGTRVLARGRAGTPKLCSDLGSQQAPLEDSGMGLLKETDKPGGCQFRGGI